MPDVPSVSPIGSGEESNTERNRFSLSRSWRAAVSRSTTRAVSMPIRLSSSDWSSSRSAEVARNVQAIRSVPPVAIGTTTTLSPPAGRTVTSSFCGAHSRAATASSTPCRRSTTGTSSAPRQRTSAPPGQRKCAQTASRTRGASPAIVLASFDAAAIECNRRNRVAEISVVSCAISSSARVRSCSVMSLTIDTHHRGAPAASRSSALVTRTGTGWPWRCRNRRTALMLLAWPASSAEVVSRMSGTSSGVAYSRTGCPIISTGR